MLKLSLPLALLVAVAANADAVKISVVPFKGADKAHKQIESSLCKAFSCVKPGKKHKEEVSAVVTGNVIKEKKKKYLELALFTSADSDKAAWEKKYGLQGGKLGPKGLSAALKGLKAAIKGAKAEEDKDETEDASEDSSDDVASAKDTAKESKGAAADDAFADAPRADKSEKSRAPVRAEAAEAKKDSDESESSDEVATPAPSHRSSGRDNEVETRIDEERSGPSEDPMLALEAGSRFFSRDLSYANPTTPIRAYKASLLVAPAVHGEFYPVRNGGLAVGLEGEYSMAVGTKTRAGAGDVTYPTSISRADVGGRLNFHAQPGLTLSGMVGFRAADFSVSAASDGSTLSAMPAISYRAVRLGAGLSYAFTESVSGFASGAYLPVLSTGEIGSQAYFSGAHASGLEASAGLAVKVGNGFEVLGVGEFTRYGLSFTHVDGAQYSADGATDQYLGGSVRLRYQM